MRFALIALIGATQAMRLTHGPRPDGDRPDHIPGDDTTPTDGTSQGHSNPPCPGEDCQEPGPMTDEELAMRTEMNQAQRDLVFEFFDELDAELLDVDSQLKSPDGESLNLAALKEVDIPAEAVEHRKQELKNEILAADLDGNDHISLEEANGAKAWVEADEDMEAEDKAEIVRMIDVVVDMIQQAGGDLHIDDVVQSAWDEGMADKYEEEFYHHLDKLDLDLDGEITAEEMTYSRSHMEEHYTRVVEDDCHALCDVDDEECYEVCRLHWRRDPTNPQVLTQVQKPRHIKSRRPAGPGRSGGPSERSKPCESKFLFWCMD